MFATIFSSDGTIELHPLKPLTTRRYERLHWSEAVALVVCHLMLARLCLILCGWADFLLQPIEAAVIYLPAGLGAWCYNRYGTHGLWVPIVAEPLCGAFGLPYQSLMMTFVFVGANVFRSWLMGGWYISSGVPKTRLLDHLRSSKYWILLTISSTALGTSVSSAACITGVLDRDYFVPATVFWACGDFWGVLLFTGLLRPLTVPHSKSLVDGLTESVNVVYGSVLETYSTIPDHVILKTIEKAVQRVAPGINEENLQYAKGRIHSRVTWDLWWWDVRNRI